MDDNYLKYIYIYYYNYFTHDILSFNVILYENLYGSLMRDWLFIYKSVAQLGDSRSKTTRVRQFDGEKSNNLTNTFPFCITNTFKRTSASKSKVHPTHHITHHQRGFLVFSDKLLRFLIDWFFTFLTPTTINNRKVDTH